MNYVLKRKDEIITVIDFAEDIQSFSHLSN